MKKNKFVIKLNRNASDLFNTQTAPNKKKQSRAQMKQKFNRGEY